MRLAVLADIHGNLVALERVLADLDAAGGADTVWVLGDLAAFGPRPAESIQRVLALRDQYGEKNVHLISGNTDRYLVTGARPGSPPIKEDEEGAAAKFATGRQAVNQRDIALNWCAAQLSFDDYTALRKLGSEVSLHANGYGWVCGYHAIPGDDESHALRPDSPDEEAHDALLDREGRLGIGGHTHMQMDRQLGTWRAVNIGSVGMSYDNPGKAQWGLFTFEGDSVTVDLRNLDYDLDSVMNDLDKVDFPLPVDWLRGRMRLDS